ncbi:hypothetical protein ABKV19_006734 [Rosa sericea]
MWWSRVVSAFRAKQDPSFSSKVDAATRVASVAFVACFVYETGPAHVEYLKSAIECKKRPSASDRF